MGKRNEPEPVDGDGSEETVGHVGKVSEAATYLIYTFDAGQRIDTHQVAHRLLKAGVAETVYSAAMPEVRVAPRYAALTGLLQRSDAVREFLAGPVTVRAGLRLWAKYPRSRASLLPLVWSFAQVRMKLRYYKSTAFLRAPVEPMPDDADDDSYDLTKMAKELIELMEELSEETIESVAQTQSVGAIQTAVDRRILRLDYWLQEPFLRLGLRSSRHRFVGEPQEPSVEGTEPEVKDPEEAGGSGSGAVKAHDTADVSIDPDAGVAGEWVDALALVHRTGVVQVMLRVPLPENLTMTQLVGRVSSHSANIAASELPEPLLEPLQLAALDSALLGEWQPDLVEGVRWRNIEFDEPSSFDDLFDLYFDAFNEALPGLSPTWHCYPVVVVDGVICGCGPDEFKTRHRDELAGVMFQQPNASKFRVHLIDEAVEDVSHRNEMIVLLNEARGVVMRWGEDRTVNWVDDLYTLVPIEQALLQRGQLASLERQFAQAASKPKHLERLEDAIITGLDEYRSSQINPGDAQAVVDRILEKSRAVTGYERLMDSVNQLHQKVTAAETRRTARQANLLAFLAVLVTLALGIPAIKQSIQIAETVPGDSVLATSAKPLVWLGDQGPAGVWGAFVVLVVIAVGTWVIGATGRRSPRSRLGRRLAGRAWDRSLEVTIVDYGQGVEAPAAGDLPPVEPKR